MTPSYEKDYAAIQGEIEELLRKVDTLETKAHALDMLIHADYPHKGKQVLYTGISPVQAQVSVLKPRVTDRVKGILQAAGGPLTTGEIQERLKQNGMVMEPKANPWALIHGICRRLVEQQFAQPIMKDGHRAWTAVIRP